MQSLTDLLILKSFIYMDSLFKPHSRVQHVIQLVRLIMDIIPIFVVSGIIVRSSEEGGSRRVVVGFIHRDFELFKF